VVNFSRQCATIEKLEAKRKKTIKIKTDLNLRIGLPLDVYCSSLRLLDICGWMLSKKFKENKH
jgi:hypothetical protein